jgi:sugar-specific transcriptional regulator TrmB
MNDIFAHFRLDEKETNAFLELVKLGASPLSAWAKRAGINRSSMYVIADRLIEAGIVTLFSHRGIMHAKPISMADLPSILERKRHELGEAKAILMSRLPELAKLEATHAIRPTVQFYEGPVRVAHMYEEVVREPSFVSVFHPGRVKAVMPEYFHKIPQAIRTNGGRARELLVRCKEAVEYKKTYESVKHEISLFPSGITFSSDTIITKEKIYLVGYGKHAVVATEIWNEELARSQSVLFDLLWKTHGT